MKKILPIALLLSVCFSATAQDLIPSQWPHMTGYWKFQNINKLTKATVGNDLTLVGTHQPVPGPSYYDTAIRINIGSYYKCRHNIAPNGGGDSVNEYSVMFDFKVLSLKKWHTFFQTDTNNKNDGECFIRPSNSATPGAIGVGSTGYSAKLITPNTWYRLVVSVKLGHFYRYYLNGDLIHEGDTQDIDDRFALNPYFLLFADENQEDDTIDIASVAVFDSSLTAAHISKLGTIDPCVLYPVNVSLGKDTGICGAATLSISAGTGSYSYKWSSGETTPAVTFSLAKHGSGSRNVWVRKTDINGCNRSDTFILGIFAAPNVNLGKDTGFCQGLKIKLTAGSASNNSFEWRRSPSAGIISKLNNMTIDSTGTYTVVMSNQFGCSDADTILVNVFPTPPKPVIYYTAKEICEGESATLYGAAGYAKYAWTSGDTSRFLIADKDLTVKMKVSDIHGCESPLSDSVHVILHTVPPAPVLSAIPDTVFCMGDSATLYVPANYSAYHWNDGQGKASRRIGSGGVFNINVTDQFGCKSAISNTIKITVNPLPARPEIVVTGPKDLCLGDSATLLAKNTEAFYEWNVPGNSRDLKVRQSGTYSLKVKNAFNCASSWSDPVSITFHFPPSRPSVLPLGKDSLTCNIVSLKYQWWVNGSQGSTDKSIKATDKAVYRVLIGSDWCWSEPSDSFLFEKTGLAFLKAGKQALRSQPNPGTGNIIFSLVNAVDQSPLSFVLMDINGKVILSFETRGEELEKGIMLDLGGFTAGIYSVSINSANSILTSKLVLE
jgi:hypothetical protein